MKDRLERYIARNTDALSDRTPTRNVWDNIELQLDKEMPVATKNRVRPIYIFLSGVAASLLIGFIFIAGFQYFSSSEYPGQTVSSPSLKEYQQLEKYYLQEVNIRLNNLEALEVDKTIENDIIQLDAIYQELKAELMASGNMNNHDIIEALIKNYTTKIELLEFIQKKYAKSKTRDEETTKI